jgi:hypothetical protein
LKHFNDFTDRRELLRAKQWFFYKIILLFVTVTLANP